MTSALSIHTTPQPAPAGVGFISLEAAARRSGRSEGHLARLCRGTWLARGQAELRKTGPGKPTWWIREDADPAIARVKGAHQIGTDLRKYPQAKRDQATQRKTILDAWDAHVRESFRTLGVDRTVATRSFAESRGVSVRTLQLWRKSWDTEGLEGLIDGRGKGAAPWADHPFLDEVKRLYLLRRRIKLTICVEMALLAAAEQGWPTTSYKTAERFIKQVDPALVRKLRYGEDDYVRSAEPFIECDYTTLESNEVWCGDHHEFDIMCADGKGGHVRPWLTGWLDERSRLMTGWVIRAESPNTDSIILALTRGIEAHGKPHKVRCDNGRDYDARALHGRTKKQRRKRIPVDPARSGGVFAALDIKPLHVQVYHGQSKPIEIFFRTMEERLGRTFTTYCGNKPENRPDDLQKHLDAGEAPTVAELADAFGAWLDHDYHQRTHRGDGMDAAPAVVFAEQMGTKIIVAADLLAELAIPLTPPVVVGQNGVTSNGIRYGQYEPALHKLLGREVRLRVDPDQVAAVRVYDLEGRFVCLAEANARVPRNATREDLRAALKQKGQHRKALRQYHEQRPRLADDLPDLMIRAAQARNQAAAAANPQSPPPAPNLRPHRSPLEDQLPALQRALGRQPLKIAVGAESVTFDQMAATFDRRNQDADAAPAHDYDAFASLGKALRRSDDDE